MIVLVAAVLLVATLLALAWTLGVTWVRSAAAGRRTVDDLSGRVALMERELRGRLRAATAQVESARASIERVAAR